MVRSQGSYLSGATCVRGACWLFKVAPSVHQMRAQDGGLQTESVLVLLQEGKRSNHQLQCVGAGGAPTPPRNS